MTKLRAFKRFAIPAIAIGFAIFSARGGAHGGDRVAAISRAAPALAIFGIDDFLIGLAIAGAASAASGTAGAIGSANAAAAQEGSANDAMGFQREMYKQQRSDMAPWMNAGSASLADLMQQMQGGNFNGNFDPSQLGNDPGYQFRMAEGQKALERSASARGMLNSGGALKSLARYSQGLASDEFQNAWGRNQAENTGRFNRLAAISGVGQQAAGNLGAMGVQHAGQMGSLYGALGNARSAGAMGTANALQGGINTLGGMASYGFMNGGQQQIPQQQQYGYSGAPPAYGQSTMGYQTQGFGPWA